jgi:hypothetical protein
METNSDSFFFFTECALKFHQVFALKLKEGRVMLTSVPGALVKLCIKKHFLYILKVDYTNFKKILPYLFS